MQRPLHTYAPVACSLIASAVFSASLGFRFCSAPPTQKIFGKPGTRASGFCSEGLLARTGLLSQSLIGSAGRAASWPLIAAEVMRLAASLHLCAPLGMDRNNHPRRAVCSCASRLAPLTGMKIETGGPVERVLPAPRLLQARLAL